YCLCFYADCALIVFLVFTLFLICFYFFFITPATLDIYMLSLHDALPISPGRAAAAAAGLAVGSAGGIAAGTGGGPICGLSQVVRSEEHTSELQSRENLVCRLLLEKKSKSIFFSCYLKLLWCLLFEYLFSC